MRAADLARARLQPIRDGLAVALVAPTVEVDRERQLKGVAVPRAVRMSFSTIAPASAAGRGRVGVAGRGGSVKPHRSTTGARYNTRPMWSAALRARTRSAWSGSPAVVCALQLLQDVVDGGIPDYLAQHVALRKQPRGGEGLQCLQEA